MNFPDFPIMLLKGMQRMGLSCGRSCVGVCAGGQTSFALTSVALTFYSAILRTTLFLGGYMGDSVPGSLYLGYQLPISYLGMPAAQHQETLGQQDVMVSHAGRRKTLVLWETEFSCSLPPGVWREIPLSLFHHPKSSWYRSHRTGSQVTFRQVCLLHHQPFSLVQYIYIDDKLLIFIFINTVQPRALHIVNVQ